MSYLDKLMNGVEVEWIALGEFIKLEKGKQLNKESLSENGLYPAYNGGITLSGYTDTYNYNANTIIISQGGASAGFVNFITTKFYANAHCYVVLPNIKKVENRFIYHFLKLNQERLMTKQHGAGIPALRTNEILDIRILIPCPNNPNKSLEIQKEIVRILDSFTEYTAELQAELQARKKQYNYYREQLLSFEDGEVEWKTLGELFKFKNGINKEKEFFGKGDAIINYTDVFKNSKLYKEAILGKVEANKSDIERFNCKKGDVFFTRTSETKNEIGYASVLLSDIPICVFSGFLIRARPTTNLLLPDYCAYCFTSDEIRNKVISSSNMTTRVTTTGTILSKIKIPIPSLAEQARIVSILDKFDTLTTSISEGLPKEIELRKKQYEYYRDLLLTFPKHNIEL